MSAFSIPISQLAEKLKADIALVARKATLDVFTAVVLKSPVDTGRFRANWNVSVGAPDTSTTESTDQARGQVEAAKALTLPLGGVTYIANGLPYARALEYGHSQQAPNGMVRLSAMEYADYVRSAVAAR